MLWGNKNGLLEGTKTIKGSERKGSGIEIAFMPRVTR